MPYFEKASEDELLVLLPHKWKEFHPEAIMNTPVRQLAKLDNAYELSYQSYILTLQHTPTGISLSDFRAFPETPHIFLNFPQEIFSR